MKGNTIGALDEDTLIAILQFLDSDKTRAAMACVCKTWQSCVRKLWHKVHFCFDSTDALNRQISWLAHQLKDCPLYLQSLELHSNNANTLSPSVQPVLTQCIAHL